MRGRCVAMTLFILAGFTGCRATIGRVVGQQFVSPMYAFEVPLPGEEWITRTDRPSTVAFTHVELAAGISISVACTRDGQAPLDILARQLFFGLKAREILQQESRVLNGVPALQTIARARLDTTEVQVNSYVAQHQGCIYDLVYFANPQDYPRGEPSFAQMLAGFHFLPQ